MTRAPHLLPGKSGTQGLKEAEEDGRVDAIAQCAWSHTPADMAGLSDDAVRFVCQPFSLTADQSVGQA